MNTSKVNEIQFSDADVLRERFEADIRESFLWDAIVADCSEHREPDDDTGRCYLGSVLNIFPSGKYYTPFACSNVDACSVCSGSGSVRNPDRNDAESLSVLTCPHCNGIGSREAMEDEIFSEALSAVAKSHGGWIESGDGDGCDVFFAKHLETDTDRGGIDV